MEKKSIFGKLWFAAGVVLAIWLFLMLMAIFIPGAASSYRDVFAGTVGPLTQSASLSAQTFIAVTQNIKFWVGLALLIAILVFIVGLVRGKTG